MSTLKKAKVTQNEAGLLVWTFANGKTFTVDPESFSAEIYTAAAVHGMKQKLSDCYAGAESVAQAIAAFEEVLETLTAGDWNAGRSGNGGIWVDALARAAKVEREAALAKWIEVGEDGQKALKANAAVKLAKAEIEVERAKGKAGAEDLPSFLKFQGA